MILHTEGDINRYYLQTLCMIFFPGASFPMDEEPGEDIPELSIKLEKTENGYKATTSASFRGATAHDESEYVAGPADDDDHCRKFCIGTSVIRTLGKLMEYRPSWGILTGVRPSKVATEMMNAGLSKTKIRKILTQEFFVFPKKAILATDVAANERRIIGTPSPADCSIYVSIPFCPTRCAYCSFVSYTSKRLLSLIPEYVERLNVDLKRVFAAAKEAGLNIKTVYFGGGTPTVLEADQIRTLLGTVCEGLGGHIPEEFTFESGRPDTITREKLQAIKDFGVKRISVNPQTLCPEVLEGIGRNHSVDDFYRAFSEAREVGIETINTDLIAGLPGDNFNRFAMSVDGIIALHPENVTVHTFCVKRSSQFRQTANIFSMRGGDAGKCVDYSQIKLQSAGYIPYYMYRQKNTVGNFENVGYSDPGKEGRYNIYMMEEVHSILAVGAGAVTKFVRLGGDNGEKTVIKRVFNHKYPYEYLEAGNCDGLIEEFRRFFEEHPICSGQ